ncbi:unnamed protein product [Scytosiphon promiscuus]
MKSTRGFVEVPRVFGSVRRSSRSSNERIVSPCKVCVGWLSVCSVWSSVVARSVDELCRELWLPLELIFEGVRPHTRGQRRHVIGSVVFSFPPVVCSFNVFAVLRRWVSSLLRSRSISS